MEISEEAQKREAVRLAQAILDGSLSPYDGAKSIWWDVTTRITSDEAWGVLARFIGGATEWEEHPEARAEINREIEEGARALIALWGEKP
ncbi:MAG: hypothetical protein M3Q23_13435 [Actinomycetota bacterium]|nr:hypothetical protein [Actinomycetota bacterium]